jgi:hypothetical protein
MEINKFLIGEDAAVGSGVASNATDHVFAVVAAVEEDLGPVL